MSYTRQVGYLVSQAMEREPKTRERFLSAMDMTPEELDRLRTGRLIPTLAEEDKLAEILGFPILAQSGYDTDAYQSAGPLHDAVFGHPQSGHDHGLH